MKIALIHDWLNQIGGAEDVLVELVKLFPDSATMTVQFIFVIASRRPVMCGN